MNANAFPDTVTEFGINVVCAINRVHVDNFFYREKMHDIAQEIKTFVESNFRKLANDFNYKEPGMYGNKIMSDGIGLFYHSRLHQFEIIERRVANDFNDYLEVLALSVEVTYEDMDGLIDYEKDDHGEYFEFSQIIFSYKVKNQDPGAKIYVPDTVSHQRYRKFSLDDPSWPIVAAEGLMDRWRRLN